MEVIAAWEVGSGGAGAVGGNQGVEGVYSTSGVKTGEMVP